MKKLPCGGMPDPIYAARGFIPAGYPDPDDEVRLLFPGCLTRTCVAEPDLRELRLTRIGLSGCGARLQRSCAPLLRASSFAQNTGKGCLARADKSTLRLPLLVKLATKLLEARRGTKERPVGSDVAQSSQ